MALTQTALIDDPQCLVTAMVDYGKLDGAIASVTATNRTTDRPIVVWATYNGQHVESPEIAPGQQFTQTFRGNQARAGDVGEIGYRV